MSDRDVIPLYFGAVRREIFGWYHSKILNDSASHHDVGIVICNPIGDDYIRAHRIIRHIAENLSAAGFDVLRFDFYGTGDSSGTEEEDGLFSSWLEDIDLAIEELRQRSGITKLSLIGLKLGATLAALAAERRDDVDSLILWSPYLSGNDFIRDLLRQHKMYKMLDPKAFAIDPPESNVQGEEALGFILSQATIDDLNKIELLKLSNCPAKKVLITGASGPAGWQETIANYLSQLGAKVDMHTSLGSDKFLVMINHQATLPEDELGFIKDWMSKNHESTCNFDPSLHDLPSITRGVIEQAITFGENQSLFGILHTNQHVNNKTPAIVMLNAGTVHRIGPHRLYVKMARKWAELGFAVFRIDLSGIGDSSVGAGPEENLCYPPSGQQDIEAAFEVLETRLGINRFVLTGLCSGGDITFKMGLKDPRVIGTIMMNPLTFCIHEPKIVEDAASTRYFKQSFTNKKKWHRALIGDVNILQTLKKLVTHIVSHTLYKIRGESNLQYRNFSLKLNEKTNVPECIRYMVEHGVKILVLVTENDPGVRYVDEHFGDAMQSLKNLDGYQRIDLIGTDHTFTSVYAQQVAIETITQHLLSKHL